MKILFLNTENGTRKENITDFLKKQLRDVDIFCLQETYSDSIPLWENIFINHKKITADKCILSDEIFAQTIYCRENIHILSSQIIFGKEKGRGLGIYVEIEYEERIFHICNFHGLAYPGDKLDTQERLKQSHGLIDSFKNKDGLKIIGGDFNLSPDTKSIKMFEEYEYRNLIKNFDIKTTRNHFAWDRFPDDKQYYADYVFVNKDVNVQNFSVIDNEVSDHLPLILEIEV